MWYEERIINGVLCFRGTPNGDWHEFTKESLTKDLIEARKKIEELEAIR